MTLIEKLQTLKSAHPFTPKRVPVKIRPQSVPYIVKGSPWLYADAVAKAPAGRAGDIAVVFDPTQKFIAAGLYDPESPIVVKIYTRSQSLPNVGTELFDIRASEAYGRRAGRIPSATDAYRLINGDADSFPGLVVDKYSESASVKIYSAAVLPHIYDILCSVLAYYPDITKVVFRLSREVQNLSCEAKYGIEEALAVTADGSEFDGLQIFHENGLSFEADLKHGQKTGFFRDQRGNRALVGRLASNATVLNVFSYSGGFSLYAARGGALEVTSIDFNAHAIEGAVRNFELNMDIPEVARCRHTPVVGEAFEEMEKLNADGRKFDIVIVDPPSFAKSASEVENAIKSYQRLAKYSTRLLERTGTLVFASCSSRVSPDLLFTKVKETAARCGYPLIEDDRTFHEFDHPTSSPESIYLKCMYAHLKQGD